MISLRLKSFSRYSVFILIHICLILSRAPVSNTFVIKLIHYHAIDSPFYDPTKSISDLARSDLANLMQRAAYLTANNSPLLYDAEKESQLVGINSGYVARIQVGSKSLYQFVIMDTGSSFLWINCVPSTLTAMEPLINPKTSTSFRKENCNSGICSKTGAVKIYCDYNEPCTYLIRYGTAVSQGTLARETFIFGSQTLENILFGCSRRTSIKLSNGILGLGWNHLSLLVQMHYSTFSYCLGNISDGSYSYNSLVIGEQLPISGDKIPLIIEDNYYVNLEGITIGSEQLDFNPQIFRRISADYVGGMVVDTGSTYTYIPRVVLDKVKNQIIDLIDESHFLSRNDTLSSKGEELVCYNGILSLDLTFFDTMEFRFEGGATLDFSVENLFHPNDEERFCLAMLPAESLGEENTVSVLGSVMQQYFYVSFDLKEKFVAFERMDCELFY